MAGQVHMNTEHVGVLKLNTSRKCEMKLEQHK